jgi:hypothetical protein
MKGNLRENVLGEIPKYCGVTKSNLIPALLPQRRVLSPSLRERDLG